MTTNQTRTFVLSKIALWNHERCLNKFTQAGAAVARDLADAIRGAAFACDGLIHPGVYIREVDLREIEETLLRTLEQPLGARIMPPL